MKTSLPPLFVRLIQCAVLAALAVLLWQVADGQTALNHLRRADPRWLAAAGLMLTLQIFLSAQRWRVTAAQLGLDIPALEAVREYYLAQAVNQSLPGGVIGDAGRAVRSRGPSGLRVSAQAVVFERIAGQFGLITVLVSGLALSVILPGGLDLPASLLMSLTASIAVALAAVVLAALVPSIRRLTERFTHAVWARGIRAQQATFSLGTALCNVAAFAFCAVALEVTIPVVALATLVPVILCAMVLPLSIGGWGLREGAAALLFPVMGATAAEGLATSIAFGLVLLLTLLPGIILPLIPAKASGRTGATRYVNPTGKDNATHEDMS